MWFNNLTDSPYLKMSHLDIYGQPKIEYLDDQKSSYAIKYNKLIHLKWFNKFYCLKMRYLDRDGQLKMRYLDDQKSSHAIKYEEPIPYMGFFHATKFS